MFSLFIVHLLNLYKKSFINTNHLHFIDFFKKVTYKSLNILINVSEYSFFFVKFKIKYFAFYTTIFFILL